MAKKKKTPKKSIKMEGGNAIGKLVNLAMWLTGILVSLAVGFGMISETLQIPYIQPAVPIAGWVVVVLTVVSVVLAIVDRF